LFCKAYALVYQIRQQKATSRELAERYNVSCRTILRNIDCLIQAGIPVKTLQGSNGGISLEMDNVESEPNLKELQTSPVTIEYPNQMASPMDGAVIALSEQVHLDLASFCKHSLIDKFEMMRLAISKHNQVLFRYYNENNEEDIIIEHYYANYPNAECFFSTAGSG
jgi:predicted DNA-binding transcriptional regulator YafY